jgi:3-methyladenine DNA glycosylase AlkD
MGEGYGVLVPALRIIAAELAKWGQRRPAQAFALVEQLWRNGSRDERGIATKMLERLGKREWAKTLELAASFVGDICNWEECDQLACFGLRNVVQRHPEVVLPRCQTWVRSEGKWTRRFGVAILTSLPRDKAYRPSEQEFAILDTVMTDEAREVQGAVAWVLRNERQALTVDGTRLWLLGIEDTGYTGGFFSDFKAMWQEARDVLAILLQGIPAAEPRLLLVHNPDFAEMLPEGRIDLILCGHTHGGQVRLPFIGAPVVPSCFGQKYTSGLVHGPGALVYVNRGLGLIAPPVRFLCRREITLLRLRSTPSADSPSPARPFVCDR